MAISPISNMSATTRAMRNHLARHCPMLLALRAIQMACRMARPSTSQSPLSPCRTTSRRPMRGPIPTNGIMTTRIRVQIIPSAIRVSPVSRLRQATAQHSIPRTTTSTTRPPIRLTRQTSTTPTTASAITARITPRQRIPIRLSARIRIPQRKASAAI